MNKPRYNKMNGLDLSFETKDTSKLENDFVEGKEEAFVSQLAEVKEALDEALSL